jgi:hypothetical protein
MHLASLLANSPWMFVDLSSLALSLASRGPRSCSEFPSRATNRVPVLASAFPGTLSLLLRRVYRLPRHRRSLPAPRSSLTWFGVRSAVSASSAPVAPGLLACSRWRFVWLACSLEVHERSLGRPGKRLSEQARKASCATNRLFRRRKSSLCLPREPTSLANSSSQTPKPLRLARKVARRLAEVAFLHARSLFGAARSLSVTCQRLRLTRKFAGLLRKFARPKSLATQQNYIAHFLQPEAL